MNYVLSETAQAAPREDMALDAGGVWRELYFIDADGKLTTKDKAAHATIIEPPDSSVWDFENEDWKFVKPSFANAGTISAGCDIEYQYVNGVRQKVNYFVSGNTVSLGGECQLERIKRFYTGPAYCVSVKRDKYTVWSDLQYLKNILFEHGLESATHGADRSLVSLVMYVDGRVQAKTYTQDISKYSLPALPEGAVPYLGVATTHDQVAGELPVREVFFKASAQAVTAWAKAHGIDTTGRDDVTFYGISFDEQGNFAGTLKELIQTSSANQAPSEGTIRAESISSKTAQLMQAVEQEFQLSDWGNLDFVDRLAWVLEQKDLGGIDYFYRLLSMRLQLQAALPDVQAQQIVSPIMVTGSVRSGTTIMQRLIGLHPDTDYFCQWEADDLFYSTDENECIRHKEEDIASIYATHPALRTIHPMTAMTPSEDHPLTALEFCNSVFFPPIQNCPYELHHLFLQVLQYRRGTGKRWALKSPSPHLCVPSFTEKYPDCSYVIMERDMDEVRASAINMLAAIHITRSAPEIEQLAESYLTAREELNGLPNALRVQYAEFMQSPLTVLEAVCAHLNLKFTDEYAQACTDYLAQHPDPKA